MKKRLLITREMPSAVLAAAQEIFDVEARIDPLPLTRAQASSAMQEFDAILPTLGDQFDARSFADTSESRCKMIANFGVGYNHIDVGAANEAGVAVSNTPGAVTDATADIAVMLILMAARRASEGEAMVRNGSWKGWGPTQLLGMHIGGKTLGIIGMGRIGKAIARRCHHGFGMDIVFFNRSTVADPGVPAVQIPSMVDLAAASDVVVVALPGGPETHHIVDAEIFRAMRPDSVFVNIARGDIVDESALISALEDERIAGAGLDVYEHEPVIPDALRRLSRVSLLPHLGTAALEIREMMGLMAVENLRAWNTGVRPPNLIDLA